MYEREFRSLTKQYFMKSTKLWNLTWDIINLACRNGENVQSHEAFMEIKVW